MNYDDIEPLWYSPKQVARLLDVCNLTIYRFVKRGDLKAKKLGPSLLRISKAELERFIGEPISKEALKRVKTIEKKKAKPIRQTPDIPIDKNDIETF